MTDHRHADIALTAADCTACLVCVRECPSWCIDLSSRLEEVASDNPRRPRTVNVLESFTIDFGLCMYCGICIDLCPFDALHWVDHPQQPSATRVDLVQGMARLERQARMDDEHSGQQRT